VQARQQQLAERARAQALAGRERKEDAHER
jgi:hypothetical protein